jgi:hypothetical protein
MKALSSRFPNGCCISSFEGKALGISFFGADDWHDVIIVDAMATEKIAKDKSVFFMQITI